MHGLFLWKKKQGTTITKTSQKFLKESNRKPKTTTKKKLGVDKSSVFFNKSMESWLEKIAEEMYSTHNKGKPAVTERFIRTLRTKFVSIWLQYQKMCVNKCQ